MQITVQMKLIPTPIQIDSIEYILRDSASGSVVMGVDLGLKVPAVAVTDNGKIQFFGNRKQNKYMKRMARAKRKSLGKAKKIKVLKKLNNKEQRWMTDKDHKVSREIVNFAKSNNVSAIQLEELSGIRQMARTSHKNAKISICFSYGECQQNARFYDHCF